MKKYFTGIGSRNSSDEELKILEKLSANLSKKGFTLRSGHAQGADRACERGAKGNADIYLPWEEFGIKKWRNDPGMKVIGETFVPEVEDYPGHLVIIMKTTRHFGRDFKYLTRGVKKLLFRNVFQIIGHEEPPIFSKLVICSFVPGRGGTRYAVKIAEDHMIPVVNVKGLSFKSSLKEVNKILEW